MATTPSRKATNEIYKASLISEVTDFLKSKGEDVLRIKSGEICFPFVNSNGDDEFLKIAFSVPNGSRDGEPFDGYGEAESYALKLKNDAQKKEEAAAAKAKKIARDEAYRAKKAENAEKRNAGE